ncbi:MAG: cupin domain-containing protein [Aurantimicrobium sp.]|nr:cupin domain-containing protein [Aurantimicrobium sp.]
MTNTIARSISAVVLTIGLSVVVTGCSAAPTSGSTPISSPTPVATVSVSPLLKAAETNILGQAVIYPDAVPAQVSSTVLTVPAGATTGWHFHTAPMYAYILEGALTVTYETETGTIEKVYRAGEAFLEAVGTHHRGNNNTTSPVRVLVVNIGAEGVANSTPVL